MIPAFPEFTPIDRAVIPAIERLATRFEPYSEYNATNMWCWAAKYQDVSQLNGNLVMRFRDAESAELSVSFLGTELVRETVETLLGTEALGDPCSRLRLVPEVVLASDPQLAETFLVEPEIHDTDYILSIPGWASLDGSAYRSARRKVAIFGRHHRAELIAQDLADTATQASMLDLFRRWAYQKGVAGETDTATELAAFRRMLEMAPHPSLEAIGLVEGDVLLAFTVCERIGDQHIALRFWKADRTVLGAYMTLLHRTCRVFVEEGYRLLNIGQDLGHDGMARAKRSLRPCQMLRKYALTAS